LPWPVYNLTLDRVVYFGSGDSDWLVVLVLQPRDAMSITSVNSSFFMDFYL
jgi:hypothetical protein